MIDKKIEPKKSGHKPSGPAELSEEALDASSGGRKAGNSPQDWGAPRKTI